jgi:hypothetical protein
LASSLLILGTAGTFVNSHTAVADNDDHGHHGNKPTAVEIVSPIPVPVRAQISASVPLSVNANVVSSVPINAKIVSSVPIVATVPPPEATTPFQATVEVQIPDGTTGGNASFDVPAGKRLVIESIAGSLFLGTGQTVRVANIRTDFSGAFFSLVVTPVPAQSDSVSILTHSLKLYASQNVEFSVSRAPASNGLSFCFFSVSGYLVDL